MNNIDILEDLLSTQKQYIEDKDYQKEHNINEQAIDYLKRWAKAIENLIAENKEVKEEIEELKENNGYHLGFIDGGIAKRYEYEDKIKAKIEDILNSENGEAIEKLIEWQSLLGKE